MIIDKGIKKNPKQIKSLMFSYIYGKTDIDPYAPRASRSQFPKKELDTKTDKKYIMKKQMNQTSKDTYKADKRILI